MYVDAGFGSWNNRVTVAAALIGATLDGELPVLGSHDHVPLRCKCGQPWKPIALHLIYNGAKSCGCDKSHTQTMKTRGWEKTKAALEAAAAKHGVTLPDPLPVVTTKARIAIKCVCGDTWSPIVNNFIHDMARSCGCRMKEFLSKRKMPKRLDLRMLTVESITAAAERAQATLQIDHVPSMNELLDAVCRCGDEWHPRAGDLFNGKVNSCGCTKSQAEEDVVTFLESFGHPVVRKHRLMRDETRFYRVDALLPARNFGVEYNGLVWHGEAGYTKIGRPDGATHCRDKHRLMAAQGNRLVTIFEDEWLERRPAVEGYLRAILGTKTTRGARECEVVWDPSGAREFVEANHLQGAVEGQTVGLVFGGELLAVAVFATARPGLNAAWDMKRFCSHPHVGVAGGFSRLVAAWRARNTGRIVTFSDNRWSDGNVYLKSGFRLDGEVASRYSYFKGRTAKRLGRFDFRKDKLAERGWLQPGETEWACMQRMGYDRIWDAGKRRWVMD